jgi:hypothetical protein
MENKYKYRMKQRSQTLYLLVILMIITGLSCNIFGDTSSDEDDSTQETQVALGIQQTLTADAKDQAVPTAESQTAVGDGEQPTPDSAATQAALSAGETPAGDETPPTEPTNPPTVPADEPEDPEFEERMHSANILLYEDIINYPQLPRFVKNTLDSMDVPYDDVGSAKGDFKEKILGGAPSGQPWDLIIVAAEARGGIQGEFFEHLNQALERGSSIIFEVWHLDQIYLGKAAIFLNKCGVSVRNYAGKNISDVAVFPVSGVDHPILNEPNGSIIFTNPTPVWAYSDLGDLFELTGSGSGQIIMATDPNDSTRNGVVTVCEGGKVIFQTFNSHNFPENVMRSQWENYIYNALKIRFQNAQ